MSTEHRARIGFAILFSAALSTAVAAACASQPKPRPTALDPSNPTAPESPPLAVTALHSPAPAPPPAPAKVTGEPTATPPASETSGAEHGHNHGGRPSAADKDKAGEGGTGGKQQAATYTCPMHPEVVSDKPGRCPKCGMKLVPKQPAEGKK